MVQIRQKPCRKRHDNHMTDAGIIDRARDAIALAAGPRGFDDTRESWLSRAARRFGMSYARVRKIWYRRVDDLWASEWQKMQEKAEEIRQQLQEIEAANAELRLALGRCNVRTVEGSAAGAESGAAGAEGTRRDGDVELVARDGEEGARPGAAPAVRLGKVGE